MADLPADPAPPLNRLAGLAGLWPFLRPYRRVVALAFVLLCLAAGATLAVPMAISDLIDHGFAAGAEVHGHFIALFLLALFGAAMVAARYFTVSWIGERVTADLRMAVYRRMLAQPPGYFETTQTGEVLSRLTTDTTLVQTVVGSAKLLRETGDHPTVLRERVTSPGGTTAAAVRELEESGLRGAFYRAAEACSDKAKELG